MPKDDARPFGQGADARQQPVAEPLIGHQPDGRQFQGLAAAHPGPYSVRMSEEAKAKLDAVNAAIAHAAKLAGRKTEDVALVAISKTHGGEAIRPLLDAGQRAFGENRVQEAQAKWPALIADYPDVELHLVGQLQSNKAEDAVALFDVIHGVDRISQIDSIAKAQEKLGKHPRCFIQVNLADEAQKGGCSVDNLPALLEAARAAQLDVAGLMTVPPAGLESAPWFAFLAKLARDHSLPGLSMGMSGDYETAVMLGASHVRVGSALFGARG
jgi:PLP dependent protein